MGSNCNYICFSSNIGGKFNSISEHHRFNILWNNIGIFLVGLFFKKIQAKNIFNSALSTQIIIFIIFYLDVVGYLWLNFIGSFLTVLLAYILQKVAKE